MTFQILSLSGGGFLGLYSIAVIDQLERQIKRPIASCFDLLAGTSVGGIIALGLAANRPAREIRAAFENYGSRIFSKRPAPTTLFGKFVDSMRSATSAKYGSAALRETITTIVGKDTLIGDLAHPVIIPTVNLTKGKPQVFKTAHHPSFKVDHRLRVVDVALATSAAPTYFPVAEIEDELFTDGGLYANSPDLVALHEAEFFFKKNIDEIHMLSIGTTTTHFSISHVGRKDLGVWGWRRRLAQTMISSQQMDVGYMLGHKLADRYVRIDEVQSKEQERDLGLDVATESAQKTIRGLAAGSVQRMLNDGHLGKILAYTAPEPAFHHRGA